MSKTWKFIPGDWNLICDVCGTKVKASQSKHRWDGLIVCPKDFEFRHPQDFLRSKIDKIAVPFSRPQPTDQFGQTVVDENGNLVTAECDLTQLALADIGLSDAALADIDTCEELNAALAVDFVANAFQRSAVAGFALTGYAVTGNAFLGGL